MLIISLMGTFLLGAYAFSVLHDVKEVTPLQWAGTSLFTIYFLFTFLKEHKS